MAAVFHCHAYMWRNVSATGRQLEESPWLINSGAGNSDVFTEDMKHLRHTMAILLAGGLSIMAVSPALASGTAWADAPVLPDPSLANGPVFPASAATAGTAVVSAAADGPLENCSRHNPCAMPTPASDHVAVVSGAAITPLRHAPAAHSAKPVITVAPNPGGKPES